MEDEMNRRGRRPVREISARQRRTLEEIRNFLLRKKFPPTIKELAGILGISHASAHEQVTRLVRKGYLTREPQKARGLALVESRQDD
jgi:repressor LexA